MKKIILTAMAVFAFSFANAQEKKADNAGGFKLGAHVGLPMGDIKDAYSLNLGVDVAYVWNVAENFGVGIASGYTTYIGKAQTIMGIDITPDAVGFIPVAATAQYSITDSLFLGTDLGYAVYAGNQDGAEGGFYYQPKFGFQTEKIEVFAGYKGISVTGGAYSSVNLGFNYKF